MAINDFLKQDINRLVNPAAPKSGLPDRVESGPILNQRGSGLATSTSGLVDTTSTAAVAYRTRKEVVTVFSTIILTEEGAFEKPSGWPTSGTYPGSGYTLDTSASYYEQKRVHIVVYEVNCYTSSGSLISSEVVEDHLLIPLAAPFDNGGYYQGLNKHGSFTPALQMFKMTTTNSKVQSLIASYQSQGVAG